MPEERITLKFKESKLVWNRWVKYEDYDLMTSKAYITSGNEKNWLHYLEGVYTTPDFYIMLTNYDMVSVSLLIRYGADAPMRWSCSDAPLWKCFKNISGEYATESECKSACKGVPGCIPVWKCEVPRNGYENDGCGTRRANAFCDPIVSVPLTLSASPTTIKVGDLITVSGKYKSGAKVIIMGGVKLIHRLAEAMCNSVGSYSTMIYLNKPVGTYNIRAKSDVIIFPDLSNIVTITITAADTPCEPVWRCKEPKDGYESDGCGRTAYNSLCLPVDPKLPCADGNTRIVQCPYNPSKTYTEECKSGKWIPVDKDICETEDVDKDKVKANITLYILLAVVVIMVIMILVRKR